MAGHGILDADMKTVAGWLRQGWQWWINELTQLVPDRWRTGDRILAERGGAGEPDFRFTSRGRAMPDGYVPRGPVTLALPANDVLVCPVDVPPKLGAGDLRRMLALDIGQLTPLRPDAVFFDAERCGEGNGELAVVRRGCARELLAAATAAGLEPAALSVIRDGRVRFDFLRAIRDAGEGDLPTSNRYRWWLAIAALAVVNLAVSIIRDIRDVSSLSQAVEAQSPELTLATATRARIERERARRAEIAARRRNTEPLAVLATVTRALPSGAWVQRYAWSGQKVRLIGYKQGSVDLIAALRRTPGFADVRTTNDDVPAQLAAGQPFDLTARLVAVR